MNEMLSKNGSFSGSGRVLGLCLGASTVSIAMIEKDDSERGARIIGHSVHPHEGNPRKTLLSALESIDVASFDRIVATGRKFRNFVNLTSIPEPEAVEHAYSFLTAGNGKCNAVVSAGGETFMVYVLNKAGLISNVLTGNKCASGTGEFFLQQLRRMNVTLEEAALWASEEEPYHVSGRCSVFCKSDCTHATNKGIPKSKVTAGLCKMMAEKIIELLKKIELRNIMIAGGTAQNKMMVSYLNQAISGLVVPDEAPFFEALGAALWGLSSETAPFPGFSNLLKNEEGSFDRLEPLKNFEELVSFKTMETDTVKPGDVCILGLDVGSTTTKAVLIRTSDKVMLASVYLRTNGDPVGASRACYRNILEQVRKTADPSEIRITGLGVCGSGRQIAGLHALTDGVINEIIAHAVAAVHFDSDVDTIFEIGGQDAKYTYVTNGVASDYAMNEACSAGTGSFLEESAYETLGIKMEDIADVAIKGPNPPNFNDQCAAFISSDIKNAIHEGILHEDIVAGLVYSICMNYSNRVKGNRPVGEKVFMQGGVCYNRAVPLAMAALVGKPIVVPPEPGLMGAFGVALEVKKRIDMGLMKEQEFDLEVLADREVVYGKTFTCGGGKEKCDRGCNIAMIHMEGKKYPFGGACNRYYNLRHDVQYDVEHLDFVRIRKDLVYRKYAGSVPEGKKRKGRIGFNRSFLVNSYFPLYSNFFGELGFEPVIPDELSRKGVDARNAPFCYPAEISHGFFYSLITMEKPPDYIFLPHFKAVHIPNSDTNCQVCPFVQGETFFLRATFRKQVHDLEKKGIRFLTPLIDIANGIQDAKAPLVKAAREMGVPKSEANAAFEKAVRKQMDMVGEMKQIGRQFLDNLEKTPEKSAAVIFGRPYNSLVEEAHMGIPHKFASRGIPVIPIDFLPIENEKSKRHMYWGMGQLILKAARFVKKHPQLFGTYITNFSCGPDSFIVGYFRDIMGQKPSLTLELDSHTADAGIETRIEAFLDIVTAYRQLIAHGKIKTSENNFNQAKIVMNDGHAEIITSSGEIVPFSDPRVTMLLPSMGKLSSEALAAVFRKHGINAVSHKPANEEVLKLGRAHTACKECLPLILTTGMLLKYINNGRKKDDILVYFMATAAGPCRFGQYLIFLEDLVRKLQIPDVALFTLTSENSYGGIDSGLHLGAWWGFVIADIMEDARSMLLANAKDPETAISIFFEEWEKILTSLEKDDFDEVEKKLVETALKLSEIPMKKPVEEVPVISLVGEIFVRRDSLSRRYITELLAEKGFATVCSPVSEWLHYSDYLLENNLTDERLTFLERIKFQLKKRAMMKDELRMKSALGKSGLVSGEPVDLKSIIKHSEPFISVDLTGEAVLTVGASLLDVANHACGVIAIGPFGCMPNRLSESILNETMTRRDKMQLEPENHKLNTILEDMEELPFLAIESDGSPFPQVITAKLESFCLRSERLHKRMIASKNPG